MLAQAISDHARQVPVPLLAPRPVTSTEECGWSAAAADLVPSRSLPSAALDFSARREHIRALIEPVRFRQPGVDNAHRPGLYTAIRCAAASVR